MEIITDKSKLVDEIKNYKYLKVEQVQNQDDEDLAKRMEKSGDRVMKSLQFLAETDLETAQTAVQEAYNLVGFDPVDLKELDLDTETIEMLIEKFK